MFSWLVAAVAAAALAPLAPSGAGSSGGSAAHDTALAWFDGREPTPQARAMAGLLQQAAARGLRPEDYEGAAWPARLSAAAASPDERVRAEVDAAFTAAATRFVRDLRGGRVDPRRVGFALGAPCDEATALDLLRREVLPAADVAQAVAALEPPFAGYRRAVDALQRYQRAAREDGGEPLPVPARPVVPGNRYAGALRLAELLRRVGDLGPGEPPATPEYDAALSEAVARFQRRHGLEPHGRLDAATARALNVPLARRAMQLALTLERWRWLPRAFPSPPVVVNIPEFRLHAGDPGARWSTRVVVGRAYGHRTPVFTGELSSVVFRPWWKVPLAIQREEIAPKVARDPAYLARERQEAVAADGTVVDAPDAALLRSGAVRLRQRPGPHNALGLVKFSFPNVHDVYMHGTPATGLFRRARRDFSHGCIRVEDPVRLARWVLAGVPGWTEERIVAAMNADATREVRLPRPVPVLILYGTATVSEQGEVSFFDDVYGLDASLERALEARRPAID